MLGVRAYKLSFEVGREKEAENSRLGDGELGRGEEERCEVRDKARKGGWE